MMRMSCEAVRERLPEHLAGTARSTAAMIDAHLEGCAECRADAALLEALRRHPVLAPRGLREKVVRAVVTPALDRYSFQRRVILAAACLTAALLGGRALMENNRAAPALTQPSVAARPVTVPDGGLLQPFPGSSDASATTFGNSSLEDLSNEQLRSLIAELQS
jgi:predicted anti-sigma-YlaC factor YlaD